MGRRQSASIYLCLYLVALNVYCASNVWVDVCNSHCLVLHLQLADFSRTVTGGFEGIWAISRCGTEQTHNHDGRTPYSSLATALSNVYVQ